MLPAERRGVILKALNSGGAVRVADLAAELEVSEMTVRRDLDNLDAQELLLKVHGGAVARHNRGDEPHSSVKAGQQRAEKAAIAAAAADTVEDGMTIAIGAGTTTTESFFTRAPWPWGSPTGALTVTGSPLGRQPGSRTSMESARTERVPFNGGSCKKG